MCHAVNSMVFEKNEFEVSVSSSRSVADAVGALTEALKLRGYGVLGTIDVRKTLREKAGRDVSDFTILDVCNPSHAVRVIERTDKAGLLLPCKLSLRKHGSETKISMIRPGRMFGLVGDSTLGDIAEQVEQEITEAMKSVGDE